MIIIGAVALSNPGAGSGPIFLHNVVCTGLEYRLVDCPSGGIELSGCSHHQDAGVRCLPG